MRIVSQDAFKKHSVAAQDFAESLGRIFCPSDDLGSLDLDCPAPALGGKPHASEPTGSPVECFTALYASDGTRLAKAFWVENGAIRKAQYPLIHDFISESVTFHGIETLHDAIVQVANRGGALVKGQPDRPIVHESRAGRIPGDGLTSILTIDWDGGLLFKNTALDAVDELLTLLGLETFSHVVQFSSSYGMSGNVAELKAHVFLLFDGFVSHDRIRDLVKWLNLSVSAIRDSLKVRAIRSGADEKERAGQIKWMVDPVPCLASQLNYIAHPTIEEGVPVAISNDERILLRKRERERIPRAMLDSVPQSIDLNAQIETLREKLAEKQGLVYRGKFIREGSDGVLLVPGSSEIIEPRKVGRFRVVFADSREYFETHGGNRPCYYYEDAFDNDHGPLVFDYRGGPARYLLEMNRDYYFREFNRWRTTNEASPRVQLLRLLERMRGSPLTLMHSAGMVPGEDPASAPAPATATTEEALAPAKAAVSDDENGAKQSQTSALVAYVLERADLFHDENRDVFATNKETGETRRLDSRHFRDWLTSAFYKATRQVCRDQSTREALSTLSGLAREEGECIPVFVRVAKHEDDYFLDLAERGTSRAVRVSAGEWEIVERAPVRFLRPDSMKALPEPERGADLASFWRVVNVSEADRLLVLAWLGDCLRPDTPFPVLELFGEQESAKSSAQEFLRMMIDPNACLLRKPPKSCDDVFIGAGVNWLVSYENVSHLCADTQDALCILATGGGFAKRKLYSDADESVINVKRPIVLNGISAAVTAQDLVSRTISVEIPKITERIEKSEVEKLYAADHGRMLGALLDLVAGALARLPGISLPPNDRPRLIEFAHFGMAMAEAMGKTGNDFMSLFRTNRLGSIARTIDASPVASALLEWFEDSGRAPVVLSVGKLFEQVEFFKRRACEKTWPRSAKGFADGVRRVAPALRTMGIECRFLPRTKAGVQLEVRPTT